LAELKKLLAGGDAKISCDPSMVVCELWGPIREKFPPERSDNAVVEDDYSRNETNQMALRRAVIPFG
jgi:hypothetical protein